MAIEFYEENGGGMTGMINYDDLKVTLSHLAIISDMALVTDDRNSTYATLTIVNTLLQDLVSRLEEREISDSRT
ncbi:hypothetical protein ACVV62_09425 [Streptococcus pluranimalium]